MTDSRKDLIDLYTSLAPRLVIILARRIHLPPDSARDAVHDVFLSILESPQMAKRVLSLDTDSAFRYLFVAAQRRALRELSLKHLAKRQPEDLLATLTGPDTPESELSRLQIAKALRAEFDRLGSPYREVLELLLVERRNYQEISERLHRPVNTVYQQVHRALQRLRAAAGRYSESGKD